MEDDYGSFLSEIRSLIGLDLGLYQEKQMKRRIETRIARLGFSGFSDYASALKENAEEREAFSRFVTINVTDFFRTPEQWDDMVRTALSDLAARKSSLRLWSAACSSGEEAYSLAISVEENFPGRDYEVLATDLNEAVLEEARKGCYSALKMNEVPEAIRTKYFAKKEDGSFEVCAKIKSRIRFEKMDLLKIDYPRGMDLILARNVLIYFTKEGKEAVLGGFRESLLEGGYLFTGNTEQIIYPKRFLLEKRKPYLYQRVAKEEADMGEKRKEPARYKGRRRILIVEDNEINREILSALLEDEYEILAAKDGKEGYEVLSREYKRLSLILLDVYMPVMNGFEFLERIRGDAVLSSIPVIVTTGSDKPDDEVKCLKLGASDFVTKPYNPEVVLARVRSIIKLKESVATLSAVEYDPLTGLYTIEAFYHHVTEMLSSNPEKSFDLAVADIKDFKLINAVSGEAKANELLCYIAKKYEEQIPFSIIARKGGRFFSLYDTSLRFNAKDGGRYYEDLIENAPVAGLSVKYGIYANVDKRLPIAILCDRAILAAQSIRNDFAVSMAFYDEKAEVRLKQNEAIKQDFDRALLQGEFRPFYQPKVDPSTGKIVAAEALVRWRKEDGTTVSPGAFVPLFEKDGLIIRLDEAMFRMVCEYQKKRMAEGKKAVPISVNLSRNSIYSKGVAFRYRRIAEHRGIPLSLVPIEITESATTEGNGVLGLAEELSRVGFSLHMDDFGTGYSSLSSLVNMPFDVLKLDKSLVDRIGNQKGDLLLAHLVRIAQEMGMKTVAEGAEKKEQVDFLQEAGVDMVQGYYYSAPKAEEDFSAMLDAEEETKLDLQEEYEHIRLSPKAETEADEAMIQTMRKLADEMMEGFLVYKATPDETIIYANEALIDLFRCDSMEDFRALTSNSFRGIVDPEDYKSVENSIFHQIHESGRDDAVEYHIRRKDGTKAFVLDRGHCIYTEAYGKVFYVFIKER